MRKKENISKTDKQDWDDFIKDPKGIFNKELETNNLNNKKKYRFDLHGYTLAQANKKVREIIYFCKKEGCKEIFLITGKGIHSNTNKDVYVSSTLSNLRYSIPDYINSQPDLIDNVRKISPALPKEGGDGALVIKLK
ncbi:MAG: DNA mismatch repair protein MutS [Candidatus Pelagibacter sp.]|nr:DNA mismatch repair protein MutS [Candidatus Pelagibacter sp.]RPG11081.1 MAG: DNA mismatch repair protein MutS [Pelagibacteraceae bacterium TMED170]